MKKTFIGSSSFVIGFLVVVFALSITLWMSCEKKYEAPVEPATTQETIVFNKANPQIQAVMAVQDRHTAELMANPDVVGTATGLTEDGRPAILVFTKTEIEPKSLKKGPAIPVTIEGVPVVVKVTGEIIALKGPPPGGGHKKVDPTSRFNRPVPIGVSTGNIGECSAGTIGCRVKSGSDVYALSNNHVYALENNAPIGSEVLQPGRYDTNCNIDLNDVIGTLFEFEPIDFSRGNSNTIDAAIAVSSTGLLDNATPSNGYGLPKSTTVAAAIGQAVQKYGRTTSLTKGTITAINATVDVGYSSGTATFVDQIFIQSKKPVIKAGDSGSLLVTDPGRNPVGLMFAGDQSGKFAIANRIDLVLNRFNVTIDGE